MKLIIACKALKYAFVKPKQGYIPEGTDTSALDAVIKPFTSICEKIFDENPECNVTIQSDCTYSMQYNGALVTMDLFSQKNIDDITFLATIKISPIKDSDAKKLRKDFARKINYDEIVDVWNVNNNSISIISSNLEFLAYSLQFIGINSGEWRTNGIASVDIYNEINLDF